MPEGWRFTTLPVTTRCPAPGEQLTIVGFRFAEPPELTNSKFAGLMEGDLFAAAGEVVATYHPIRDKVLMPFPTIEVACGSLHGMSGGAVLDQNGALMGIVSRSLKSEDGNNDGPTSAVWLIGALGRRLDLPWPSGLYGERVEIMAIPERLLHIIGRDAVTVTESRTEYRVWFGPGADS